MNVIIHAANDASLAIMLTKHLREISVHFGT